ncbi:hypothetical protein QMK81_29900, partial [Klebsiella pneumoniae]|uniref:hypothetical protein n=1 Tax=Klebsiella pneumoniae TaxID=573 RepID=UPI003A7FE736
FLDFILQFLFFLTLKPSGKRQHFSQKVMEILQSAVIFLLVFSFSFTAAKVPPDVDPRYQKFLRQHVDADMSVQKCDRAMSIKKITAGTGNDCKEVNTFIQANGNHVRTVCTGGGTRQT